jgi:isoquinoline 1-oxidoreductase beta subunit
MFKMIAMKSKTKIPRRTFIRLSALSGASLFAIGFLQSDGKEPEIVNLSGEDVLGARMNAYIFIDSLGVVTIYNHRPEMGQGTFESIPMIIAEELEVDINGVNIMASPANRSLYGNQMVVGSQSIRSNYELMRKIGASAKETLITAAANAGICLLKNAMHEMQW